MKINLVGNPNGISGFATHTREFAKALDKAGIDVSIETQKVFQNDEKIHELMWKKPNRDGINIFIDLPYSWRKIGKTVGFGVFEGSKIHTSWKRYCKMADHIIVPSNHVKDAFKAGGFESHVIPEGVDRAVFNEHIQKENNIFTFLFNKGWSQYKNDRSGLDLALRAFTEEFGDENVRFIVKINPAYGNLNYPEMIKSLNLKGNASTKIMVNSDNVSTQQMAEMYRNSDVLVCPTKAEGFGLNILEAMSCGTPAIVTNYGGHLDFCNNENSWLIGYEVIKATDRSLFYEEADWAYPDVMQIRKAMREAYENRELLAEKSKNAIEISKQFTWEKSAEKAIKLFESF
jgi:glycosyltransferase involved in cell wall biosynthesis